MLEPLLEFVKELRSAILDWFCYWIHIWAGLGVCLGMIIAWSALVWHTIKRNIVPKPRKSQK